MDAGLFKILAFFGVIVAVIVWQIIRTSRDLDDSSSHDD